MNEHDVTWFGASHRLIAGRPDTRYGWLDTPEGPCIVKALDLQLAGYSAALLDNERSVLRHLHAAGAPVPELLAGARPDWLITRFAGLSHRRLRVGPLAEATFPFEERVAAWVHFLRRARQFDEAGALPIDLWGANLVLPLTDGTSGQLRLHKAMMIDHAHTVVAGLDMRRPVWMDREMRRVPPELRAALRDDQEALLRSFHSAGAALSSQAEASEQQRELMRRLWAEYDAPQHLQRTLDNGRLDRGAAMQFAVAIELQQLLRSAPAESRDAMQAVVGRMLDETPAARFDSLDAAAVALQGAVLPSLPMVGHHRFAAVGPADVLVTSASGRGDPAKRETYFRSIEPAPGRPVAVGGTTVVKTAQPSLSPRSIGSPQTLDEPAQPPTSARKTRRATAAMPMSWAYAMAAAGAAIGTSLQWPW